MWMPTSLGIVLSQTSCDSITTSYYLETFLFLDEFIAIIFIESGVNINNVWPDFLISLAKSDTISHCAELSCREVPRFQKWVSASTTFPFRPHVEK
jgi:hypothetical protein